MTSDHDETPFSRLQPYDTSFKALIDDVTLPLLSYLYGEEITFAKELKESLFKQNAIKPPLRVDCAFLISSSSWKQTKVAVGHIEVETAPTNEVERRLFEYAGLLCHKHDLPVWQVLLCPFETSYLPTSPFQQQIEGRVLTKHDYIVVALWQREAQELVERKLVELYVLLPTMKGATYELLVQALKDMRVFFAAQESRLCNHLLWFDALLGRTTMVRPQDKRRIRYMMMNEFHSLLDEGYFVQQRMAQSRQEGLIEGETKGRVEGLAQGEAKGREEGLEEGLTEALLAVTEVRFPTLLELAQQRVRQVRRSGDLRLVLKGVKTAASEEAARAILDLLAA